MSYPYCAVYLGPQNPLCSHACVDGLTCKKHKGFYAPSTWLRRLDSVVMDSYQKSHIKIALQNKIKVQKEDMKYLPNCITEITERGVEFAPLLYLTNRLIERSWSEPLWELCLWKLTEVLHTGNKERISYWVHRLLKTKKDVLDYLYSRYFRNGLDCGVESAYKLFFDALFKRPEFAFALDAEEDLFDLTREHLKTIHRLSTQAEPIIYDDFDNDTARGVIRKTFVVAKERVLQKIREQCGLIKEELMAKAWHPDRVERVLEQYDVDLNDD
jgi:hypothetical protein